MLHQLVGFEDHLALLQPPRAQLLYGECVFVDVVDNTRNHLANHVVHREPVDKEVDVDNLKQLDCFFCLEGKEVVD